MNFNFEQGKVKTPSPGMMVIAGGVVTTTGGTISSSNIVGGGASIAKTGGQTGRYTITLNPPSGIDMAQLLFLGGYATVIGPDTAALTTTKGLTGVFRRDDISNTALVGSSAKDGTIELQWVQSNAGNADTEVQDAAAFTFVLFIGYMPVL